MKSAAVMFDYRRIALWIAVLIVPGGILLLPLLLAEHGVTLERVPLARWRKAASKSATQVPQDGPTAPTGGPGSSPASPDGGPPPRLAA